MHVKNHRPIKTKLKYPDVFTPGMLSKSSLAVQLSKLRVFEKPSLTDEQYSTDSEAAAEALWFAVMHHDIENKLVADLGCGTGILGIGALLLGAKKVFFVDKDAKALKILRENIGGLGLEKDRYRIEKALVSDFKENADVVIQNPPFGTKQKHSDRSFLAKAFETARVVYSFHLIESRDFIAGFARDSNFRVTHILQFNLPLKATQKFHKRKIHRVKVGCWRMEKL